MSIEQLLLWHLEFSAYYLVAFIVFLKILLYIAKKQKSIELPQQCYLERVFGKRYYAIKVLVVGIIICTISVLFFKSISMFFIALVIPIGLLLIKHTFYEYKSVFDMYKVYVQNPLNSFVFDDSPEELRKQIQLRWNQVMKANVFQFNHPVIFLFLFLDFILPAFYFGLQEGIFLAVLLAVEYYFIGMSLWISMVGTGAIYWLGRYFPLKVSQDMKPYETLGKLAFWTVLMIAMVPGIGIPSVANIELILTSPPVQVALFAYTVANLTIFFTGIYGVHKGMIRSKQWILKTTSNEYSMMVSELLKKGKREWEMLGEKEKSDLKNLSIVSQSFRRIYEGARGLSEWPLTISLTIGGIVSAFLPAIFALLKDVLIHYLGA